MATKTFQVHESINKDTIEDILDDLSTVDSDVTTTSVSDVATSSDTLTQISDVSGNGHDVNLDDYFQVISMKAAFLSLSMIVLGENFN